MAKRILRERQMEQGAGQAPQGMAGGGIVAFQSGKLVMPPKDLPHEERRALLLQQILAQRTPEDIRAAEDRQRESERAREARQRDMELFNSVDRRPWAEQQQDLEKKRRGEGQFYDMLDQERKLGLEAEEERKQAEKERKQAELERNQAEEFEQRRRASEGHAKLMKDYLSGAFVPKLTGVDSPPVPATTNPIAPPPVPVSQDAPAVAPAGIMAAAPGAQAPVVPAAQAPVVPAAQAPVVPAVAPAGIMTAVSDLNSARAGEAEAQAAMAAQAAAAPPTAANPALAGIVESTRNAQKAQQDIAGKNLSSLVEEDKALRKSMGLDKNEGRQKYMAEQMAERANLKDEAERQRNMRLAQFFASWGSTPGSTLVAGMDALKKAIPGMIDDEKDAKKARREADKIIFELKEAERLEELGYVDRATAKKEKAAEQAQKYNQSLLQYQTSIEGDKSRAESSRYSADTSAGASRYSADTSAGASRYAADANVRIAQLREQSAALDRSANRTTADDNKRYGQYQAASQQEMLVNSRIAAEENGKQHVADVKLISDAKLMKPADMPEGYADKIAKAQERVETRENGWKSQIETAKRNTEMAFSRVRGVEPPAPAAGAPKTMTRADVEATAKAAGKTVAEVEAAAKAKGFTIK
jgi:hypothetical protein